MQDIVVFSARRAYEFDQDDILLTLLSSRPVIDFIRQAFSFELGVVGTPVETFGSIPSTMPPGLVFNFGISPDVEGVTAPIRALHIEPRRVIIDISGSSQSSQYIDATYDALMSGLQELESPDGRRAFGDPVRTSEFSDIRVQLDFTPEKLMPEDAFQAVSRIFSDGNSQARMVPALTMRMPSEVEYPGNSVDINQTYSLDIRAGTDVNDRVYYSAAPLSTERHLELLGALEDALR